MDEILKEILRKINVIQHRIEKVVTRVEALDAQLEAIMPNTEARRLKQLSASSSQSQNKSQNWT